MREGGYADLAGARVLVMTAGLSQKPGEDRLSLLEANAGVLRDALPRALEAAPDAVVVVATNPVDPMTGLAVRLAGPGRAARVLGSGTTLDTARLRASIAARAGVDPQHVHAGVLGEHGESEVMVWSRASVAGVELESHFRARGLAWSDVERRAVEAEVRGAAARIIEGKGATSFGVGAALARIAEVVLRDARAVLTVSAPSGQHGTSLSLPRLIGAAGILETLHVPLADDEARALERSASVLRDAAARV